MLQYNEATVGKCVVLDGIPYEVLSSHVFRMQMRKPVNQTKLKNLISGKVTEYSFHQAEKVEEAEIETQIRIFEYKNKGEVWFSDPKNPRDRMSLPEETVGNGVDYLKSKTEVEMLIFNEKVIGIRIPVKVELKVKEAPPSIKGNTAQGGTKQVVLETGAVVNAPLFINEGDMVRVNTETGEYVERVEKN